MSNQSLVDALMKNFPCFKASSIFFMLPWLSTLGNNDNMSFKQILKDKEIFFSSKDSKDESTFIKNQLRLNSIMIEIKHNSSIRIINSLNGGVFYHGNKLMFVLIPRAISISIDNPHCFMKSLQEIQSKKPRLSSNRGKNNRVLFEIESSHYVDLGIGVSRFFPGLYKKVINGVSQTVMVTVETYFNAVEKICKNHLPQCLMDRLNIVMNDIEIDNFDNVRCYKEQRKINKLQDCSDKSDYNSTSFMPSSSFGINNFLAMHTDKDMFLSVVHVHSDKESDCVSKKKYVLHSDIIKYFTFDNAVSVGLRSGDLLIFNPTIQHCISTTTTKYSSYNNYCISHYFKTAVASRNDNSIKFDHNKF